MELLDIIDTDLPTTGSVNMNSDKIMIVQGGVLKRTSPNVLRGFAPTGSLPPVAGDVDVTLTESSYATTDSTDNITSVTGLEEGQIFRYEFTENGGNITDGGLLEIQGKEIIGRAAGDVAEFIGKAGGVVKVNYIRKSGAQTRFPIIHVRTLTTSNVTIATALNNGDVLNGVTLATNDLVLLAGQTALEQNGVYVVGVTPARYSMLDTFDSFQGVLIVCDEGTRNATAILTTNSAPGGVIDVDDLTFELIVGRAGRMDTDAEFMRFISTGLMLNSLDANFFTFLRILEVQTVNRTLGFVLGDASRTVTIAQGNPTIAETYAQLTPVAFASLPASPAFGMIAAVNDANHHSWGDSISGGSGDSVIVWYDGADWRVMGGQP